jgi:hypothetical protein
MAACCSRHSRTTQRLPIPDPSRARPVGRVAGLWTAGDRVAAISLRSCSMIETTPSGRGTAQAPAGRDVVLAVRTSALDRLCADLERAVDQGRQLLEHPGVVRGRASDAGDELLRDAIAAFADRWEWALSALVDEAAALARDIGAAARLYDQAERTSVVGVRFAPRSES